MHSSFGFRCHVLVVLQAGGSAYHWAALCTTGADCPTWGSHFALQCHQAAASLGYALALSAAQMHGACGTPPAPEPPQTELSSLEPACARVTAKMLT